MASPARTPTSNEHRLAVRRARLQVTQVYPGLATTTADLGDTSDKENQDAQSTINADNEEVFESKPNNKPKPRVMSSSRRRHPTPTTSRPSRRSLSGDERLLWIEHLEAELEAAQTKLAAATSSTVSRQNGRRLVAALQKSKNLELCVKDWEDRYDERIQEKVDDHNLEKKDLKDEINRVTTKLRFVEELLEQKQTVQLQKAIEEVEAQKEEAIAKCEARVKAAEFRTQQAEILLAQSQDAVALDTAQQTIIALEATNAHVTKRLEIITDLFGSVTSTDICESPSRQSRGHVRPRSMLPRFPTTGNLLSSPERRPVASPAVNMPDWSLDHTTVIDSDHHNDDTTNTPSSAYRPHRRMRRFGAGSMGPRPLILPSTSSTNSFFDDVPATAPAFEHHNTPTQFPFGAEHTDRRRSDDLSTRRRASTMIDRLTQANLSAIDSKRSPLHDSTMRRVSNMSSASRATPTTAGSIRNTKNLLEELQACASYVRTEDSEAIRLSLEEGEEGEGEWNDSQTVRSVDDDETQAVALEEGKMEGLSKTPARGILGLRTGSPTLKGVFGKGGMSTLDRLMSWVEILLRGRLQGTIRTKLRNWVVWVATCIATKDEIRKALEDDEMVDAVINQTAHFAIFRTPEIAIMAFDIPWRQLKALSFDIYGTLIDWNGGMRVSSRNTALGPYLPEDDDKLLERLYFHTTPVEREHPTMKKSDINAEGLRRYATALNLVATGKLTQQQVEEAAIKHGSTIGSYPAFEDTVDAIKRLAKHYKLIPISNVDHESFNGTLSGPLTGCKFDAWYIAEDIGSYKPDLKNFHYLLGHVKSEFGAEKGELLHAAQSIFHDQEPAREVGLQSVWVDRYGIVEKWGRTAEDMQMEYKYKLRVQSLGELADIVEKALG
nr:hypothetical protein B0A51_07864 [Rachicladosporium sp. CCFEE 5018]